MLGQRKKFSSKKVFQGKFIWVEEADFHLAKGSYSREIVHRVHAAAAVPVDDKGFVCLLKQYREAVDEALLEIPAGIIHEGETAFDCIKRELVEEAGLEAKTWKKLSVFYLTPGYSDEKLHLYLATDLIKVDATPEAEEEFEHQEVSISEAMEMIKKGLIIDSKTIIGITLAKEHLENERSLGKIS